MSFKGICHTKKRFLQYCFLHHRLSCFITYILYLNYRERLFSYQEKLGNQIVKKSTLHFDILFL